MQDSDGDKSDDLVVDVSNEVRAGPGRRVAVPVQGGWRLLLSWVGAVVSQLLHRYQQPQLGDEAFGVGASSWSGGGGQGLAAWWLGIRAHCWVPRLGLQREAPEDPRGGLAPSHHGPPGQLCSPHHPWDLGVVSLLGQP